jgi:serine-type anaerobic sulfatase-maturating enzyme
MALNFTNVIKPTHICNIGCRYCYNEDTRAPIMTSSTLENTICQTLAYADAQRQRPQVDFIWHGGEPMVAGLDFYRQALSFERKYAGKTAYDNTLQTNGLLLNDEWAAFLKENRFRVSVSIDGPKHINDLTRRDFRGRGVFDRIMKGINVLRANDISFGVCVVITQLNRDNVNEIYDFLAENKLPFNVIPLTRSGNAKTNYEEIGLGPDEYAEPWINLFDRWWDASEADYIYCSDFALKTRAILSGGPTDCIGQANCSQHHVSTDPDGFVYPCATLSGNKEWSYGNLNELTLAAILDSSVATAAKNRAIDPHCAECKWQHVCHGGCMQRAYKFFKTHNTRDYYCDSLYRIYEHVERRLRSEESIDLAALPALSHVDRRKPPPARQINS